MKKMLFIFNPHTAGGRLKTRLMEMLVKFSEAGYEMCVWPTASAGHARQITRDHAAGCDLVVCCGGDGTLNEVVDGMKGLRPKPLLGYIPGGTTNDFATSLQIPKSDMLSAVDRIIKPKRIYQCDFGTFNDRAFTYVAGFGAFTDVSYKTPQNIKNLLGYFAYLLEGVQRLPGLKPTHIRCECDEGVFEDDYLLGLVSNSASVAGFHVDSGHTVQMDDGLFEMVLVRQPHNLSDLATLYSAVASGDFSSPLLTVVRGREFKLSTDQAIPWTLDGEFGGEVQEVLVKVHNKELLICT
ncbi:YegS/Rv2252/BmrU family lipid kinase [Ruminococcaceae bacterium OttesenSCG-928-D13]|nr:YegS/Rv2252/BmrU family lipid kinase [Ruminococcaceae bacterium OttesenSCG-928-D13]